MEQNGWIALGAVSALGLGVLAGGAVSAATAMPLIEVSTSTGVAPISNLSGDVKFFAGSGEVRFTMPSSTPAPTDSPVPAASSVPEVEQSPGAQQVAPAPAPAPIVVDSSPSVASSPSDDEDDEDDDDDQDD